MKGRAFLSLSEMQEEASLYEVFKSEIGLQFLRNWRGLSPLGNIVTIPYIPP